MQDTGWNAGAVAEGAMRCVLGHSVLHCCLLCAGSSQIWAEVAKINKVEMYREQAKALIKIESAAALQGSTDGRKLSVS